VGFGVNGLGLRFGGQYFKVNLISLDSEGIAETRVVLGLRV
jgi:hypothetical protein